MFIFACVHSRVIRRPNRQHTICAYIQIVRVQLVAQTKWAKKTPTRTTMSPTHGVQTGKFAIYISWMCAVYVWVHSVHIMRSAYDIAFVICTIVDWLERAHNFFFYLLAFCCLSENIQKIWIWNEPWSNVTKSRCKIVALNIQHCSHGRLRLHVIVLAQPRTARRCTAQYEIASFLYL